MLRGRGCGCGGSRRASAPPPPCRSRRAPSAGPAPQAKHAAPKEKDRGDKGAAARGGGKGGGRAEEPAAAPPLLEPLLVALDYERWGGGGRVLVRAGPGLDEAGEGEAVGRARAEAHAGGVALGRVPLVRADAGGGGGAGGEGGAGGAGGAGGVQLARLVVVTPAAEAGRALLAPRIDLASSGAPHSGSSLPPARAGLLREPGRPPARAAPLSVRGGARRVDGDVGAGGGVRWSLRVAGPGVELPPDSVVSVRPAPPLAPGTRARPWRAAGQNV
jgi:hypothetical protein